MQSSRALNWLGSETESAWLVQIVTILIAMLSPPMSDAADSSGRTWLLVILTALGLCKW